MIFRILPSKQKNVAKIVIQGRTNHNHKKHAHLFYDFSSTRRADFVHEGIKNGGSCTKQGVFVHGVPQMAGECAERGTERIGFCKIGAKCVILKAKYDRE